MEALHFADGETGHPSQWFTLIRGQIRTLSDAPLLSWKVYDLLIRGSPPRLHWEPCTHTPPRDSESAGLRWSLRFCF